MTDAGLVGVDDASGMFLGDRRPATSGSAVFPAVEGQRPLLVELQALVVPSALGTPRRSASGLDSGPPGPAPRRAPPPGRRRRSRLRRLRLGRRRGRGSPSRAPTWRCAWPWRRPRSVVPCLDDLVVIGEVGLAGEMRQVGQTPRRLAEAARLGFARPWYPRRHHRDLCPRCWPARWARRSLSPSEARGRRPADGRVHLRPLLRLLTPLGAMVAGGARSASCRLRELGPAVAPSSLRPGLCRAGRRHLLGHEPVPSKGVGPTKRRHGRCPRCHRPGPAAA